MAGQGGMQILTNPDLSTRAGQVAGAAGCSKHVRLHVCFKSDKQSREVLQGVAESK